MSWFSVVVCFGLASIIGNAAPVVAYPDIGIGIMQV